MSNISNRYQFILGNRIREEIPNLQDKIEDYVNSKNLGSLSEAELTNKLKTEYGEHAQKRIQNIIKDSFHTNECNLSWIKAINDGYSYKIWNNGRTKRTRVWHKVKFIESVPIDETFDIFGSYPTRMMYPGDLNGGAENVANCRCWLSYSNRPPSDLRGSGKKSTTRKGKSSRFSNNKNGLTGRIKNAVKKPINTIKSNVKNIKETFDSEFYNPNTEPWRQIKNKNELPNYIPDNIKEGIIDFEKEYLSFNDGNEWGISYDFINSEKSDLISDGLEIHVSLPIKGRHKNSMLLVCHCHSDNSPPSPKDICNCLENNNVYYVVIHGKKDLFVMSVKNKDESVIDSMKTEIKKCYNQGYAEALLKGKDPFDLIKRNLINNEELNKYIDMSVVVK